MSEHGVWDTQTGQVRLCARECDTCIFKPDSPFRTGPGKLQDGRFKQLVQEARDEESYVTCHSTLTGDTEPAICRGFYDRFKTKTIRAAAVIGGGRFREVEPGHV